MHLLQPLSQRYCAGAFSFEIIIHVTWSFTIITKIYTRIKQRVIRPFKLKFHQTPVRFFIF